MSPIKHFKGYMFLGLQFEGKIHHRCLSVSANLAKWVRPYGTGKGVVKEISSNCGRSPSLAWFLTDFEHGPSARGR